MSFTLETIARKCPDQTEYREGRFLVPYAVIDSVQSFWKGEVMIAAHVKEADTEYKVTFSLADGAYKSFGCSCKRGGPGLCRHQVAASLAYHSMISVQRQAGILTSPAVQKVLKDYREQNILEAMQAQHGRRVSLIPQLTVSDGTVRVWFKIGSLSKFYIVKDLVEFYFHMKERDTVQYGKFLNIVHAEWSFADDSLPLIALVMQVVENELLYFRQYNPYRPETGIKLRELRLTGLMADRLFSVYTGRQITLTDDSGVERRLNIEEENPKLHVVLERESGGCRLSLREHVTVFDGEKTLYVVKGDRLFCTSLDFTKDMGGFLREAGRTGRGASYLVANRDMPELCGQLLPRIARWTEVDMGGIDPEEYRPEPVKAAFSFDISEEGAVVCEEKLSYGSFSFNPVKGGSVPVHIYRDFPGEYRIRETVGQYFKYYDVDSGRLLLYEEEEIFRLIDEGMEEFMRLGEVYVTEAFRAVRVLRPPGPSVGVSVKGGMLELSIDAGEISEEELVGILKSYRLKKKYYRLRQGGFVKLENTALAIFSEMAEDLRLTGRELTDKRVSLPVYRALYLEQIGLDGGIEMRGSGEFQVLIRTLSDSEKISLPDGLSGTLRGYQETGYRWLKALSSCGFGGILADEMGLGKTVQVIALLLSVKEELSDPALIICPASLVFNWENELHRFAPDLAVLVMEGNAKEREQLFSKERFSCENRSQVWITSYDLLKRDMEWYKDIEFSYQVIDEAQVIKNYATQGARAVKAVRARHRFALTGTPIENRLSELWSIFDYLMKGYLYSYRYFKEEFEIPIAREEDSRAAERLRRLIGPFVLRRQKKDVLKELPEKLETVVYSRMEREQRQLYTAYAARVKGELEAANPEEYGERRIQILAALTRLRQLCCDPGLCYEDYTGGSAKLDTCMELVEEGREAGHRFLLFSQFTAMLDRLGEELGRRAIPYFVLTGSTPKSVRVQMAERFNAGEGDVFLISLKAGGTGLNLTGADMVIHYDPWWNLAAQNQAADRAHRIGQIKQVTVIRLVAKDTIEENIVRLQERKHRLAEQIIGEKAGGLSSLTREELLEIINVL